MDEAMNNYVEQQLLKERKNLLKKSQHAALMICWLHNKHRFTATEAINELKLNRNYMYEIINKLQQIGILVRKGKQLIVIDRQYITDNLTTAKEIIIKKTSK